MTRPTTSMPLPVCRFARANRCRRLREVWAYGYYEVARQKCFGLRVHARIAWPGAIRDLELLPANVPDTLAAKEMLVGVQRQVLTDQNYWKPVLRNHLREPELVPLAPLSTAKHENTPYPRRLTRKHYRIETVYGQLGENVFNPVRLGHAMPGICARAGFRSFWRIPLAFSFVGKLACLHFDFLNLLTSNTCIPG